MNRVTRETALSELVRRRRATDNFSPEPVSDSDLQEIVRAGLEAPSSYNLQPWRFVVVRDLQQRRKLRAAAMDQPKVEEAPVVIVACGDTLGWWEDLEEVIRLGQEHGIGGEAWGSTKAEECHSGSELPSEHADVGGEADDDCRNHDDVDGRSARLRHRPDGGL